MDMTRLMEAYGVESQICVISDRDDFPDKPPMAHDPVFLNRPIAIGSIGKTWSAMRGVRHEIARFKPDIVHTHLWPADVIGALAVMGTGVKHVSHQHGTSPWFHQSGLKPELRRRVTRALFAMTRPRFIAVSKAVAEYIGAALALADSRFVVVHNGTEMSRFTNGVNRMRPCTAGRLVVGAAGRFAEEKGFDTLFRAVALLRGKGVDVELRLAGDGALRPEYEVLSTDLRIRDRVHFAGLVADMPAFFSSVDVFVLPARSSEGFPVVIVESLASGTPVIATDIGGAREAIFDGESGFLVPAEDPAVIADRLLQITNDPGQIARMGAAARRLAEEQFDSARQVDRVIDIYLQLLNRGTAGASGSRLDDE